MSIVVKSIKVLRSINLINIAGSTKSRTISCNTAADILNIEGHVKKVINKKRKAYRKEDERATLLKSIDFFNRFRTSHKIKDQLRIFKEFVNEEGGKIYILDKGHLEKIKTADYIKDESKIFFMEYMQGKVTDKNIKNKLLARAGDYDSQHSTNDFITELNEFFDFINQPKEKHKKLSNCPVELIHDFLDWKEPDLYK